MSAARERFGAISLSRSSHFAPKVGSGWVKPVRLPPGWARLATKPWATGSLTATKTIGIVRVVRCIAAVAGLATAISTLGVNFSKSAGFRLVLGLRHQH